MSALEEELYFMMEWWGGHYSEYMGMPKSRRSRLIEMKLEAERAKGQENSRKAAELRAQVSAVRRRR